VDGKCPELAGEPFGVALAFDESAERGYTVADEIIGPAQYGEVHVRIVPVVLDDFQTETGQRDRQLGNQMVVVGRDEHRGDVSAVPPYQPLQLSDDRLERRIAQLGRGLAVLVAVAQALRRGEQQRVVGHVFAGPRPVDAVTHVHADELAGADAVAHERRGRPVHRGGPLQVPMRGHVLALHRETGRRADERQYRPLGRRIPVAPLGGHVAMVVHVVVERRVELGTGKVHAVRIPERLERVAGLGIATVRPAAARVAERRAVVRRPQARRRAVHELVHRLHAMVAGERVHREVRAERHLHGPGPARPVLDPVGQQQRAVQRPRETHRAQQMVRLVAEPAHARTVRHVAGRVHIVVVGGGGGGRQQTATQQPVQRSHRVVRKCDTRENGRFQMTGIADNAAADNVVGFLIPSSCWQHRRVQWHGRWESSSSSSLVVALNELFDKKFVPTDRKRNNSYDINPVEPLPKNADCFLYSVIRICPVISFSQIVLRLIIRVSATSPGVNDQ